MHPRSSYEWNIAAAPTIDWGIDYWSPPNGGSINLNDCTPWPAANLGDYIASGEIVGPWGKPPASIYPAKASVGKRNRFFGAICGHGHISGGGGTIHTSGASKKTRNIAHAISSPCGIWGYG